VLLGKPAQCGDHEVAAQNQVAVAN
jgi:hypothetical protein